MKKILAASSMMLMFAAAGVSAQEGTLAKIAELGEISVGHRDGAVPFSYYDDQQRPVGYAMDLCAKVVEAIKLKLDEPDLKVSYLPVTGATRMPLLANGTIDMECGTTTNNAERQRQVSFSNTYFVAGVRILSKKNAPVETMADAKGKTVVTLAGTTSVKVISEINAAQNLGLNVLSVKDLAEGMLTLQTERAVALIFDDVSIAGAAATSKNPDDFIMSAEPLSVEPYGIMLRRGDDAFKELVNATLDELYATGEINAIYDKWFVQPIPPRGINMNFPMSSQLKKVIAQPTDDPNPELYR
ncbi:transporter substrate-binding domain-containing protein [Ectopseudomonas mendocina]|jgi:glutamate/aspartate transport system substrate-binding protein|uniref:Amino acid ABC transporter substrate-binding protein n=2 Tax=Ectopseudomonas mendocina TaxID=300 RepID=A0ABD7RXC4_ECTME|nr:MULTISPECIES: transporter substrate-binding domain-containing protein [Pseudomonas]AEB56889.1 extracellular solute-binding protein family 3 [Pseudomonas mendocina NK-01]ALN20713.1 ABC transporter [Pseudomonas mendocina S5.2]KER98365.1 ABC transporter [Pseudomonas mendocina]QTN44165.1 transporter substrate-binding domain-containing protein [Pseudomonas mendocina]TRO15090.1 amino acid ABC transporter substrate-binding protein [Pseudomonas mendocina]